MKSIPFKIFSFIFTLIILNSCNTEDINNFGEEDVTDFPIPLDINNFWKYNVFRNTTENLGTDHIRVKGDVTLDGFGYKTIVSEKPETLGFFTTLVEGNAIRKDNSKYFLKGEYVFPMLNNFSVDHRISLNDFMILNRNLPNGELSSISDRFQQLVSTSAGTDPVPLIFEYTLKSFSKDFVPSFTFPSGVVPAGSQTTFEEVKVTDIILNLKITAQISLLPGSPPTTLVVLPPQNIITSKMYFAKGVGLIHANTKNTYTISATYATQLGIPETSTIIIDEYLTERNK